MADSPAPAIAATAHPAPPVAARRRLRPWLVGGAVACAVVALGGWWFAGRKVRLWGDGQSLHAADVKADPREVVWTRPEPLEGVNTSDQEYEPSVSPDGTELYFVRGKATRNAEIYASYRRNNAWTKPVPLAAVNSEHDELGPRLTADGMFLLFASDRPGGMGQYDIWASQRLPGKEGAWGEPFNVGPAVNSEFSEYNPAPTPDGRRLIFATNRRAAQQEQKEAWRATIRASSISDYDLWVAELDQAASAEARADASAPATQPAEPPDLDDFSLSPPSPGTPGEGRGEGSAWKRARLSVFDRTLTLTLSRSTGRGDQSPLSEGTLYLNIVPPPEVSAAPVTQPATRPVDADWDDALRGGEPFALAPAGARIEPPRVEVAPPVLDLPAMPRAEPAAAPARQPAPATQPAPAAAAAQPTTRQADAPILLVFKPAAELPGVNTPFHEGASCLSPAGDFLYFASNRTGGHGKFDLYRCRVLGEVSGGVGVKLGEVENLGPPVNTPDNETDPQLALGGFKLYMSSDRQSADGRYHGYDLLHSDSREVYDARLGRPVPRLGWSWWVLLASVLLLLPLMMFMRRWDEARLNLLQKCLLVALLIHVLVIGALSFVPVTVKLVEYVKQETGMVEVTIDLQGAGGGEGAIGLAIRQQSSSDLPVAAAPPGNLGPVDTGAQAQGKAAGVQVVVPAAGGRNEPLAIQAAAPRVDLPQPPHVAGVAPVARPDAVAVDVKVAAAPQINQLEVGPTADAVAVPVPRADAAVAPRLAPVDVKVDATPAAPNVGSLAEAVGVPRPQVPAVARVETGPTVAEPVAGAAPKVKAPRADLPRVAADAPDAPTIGEVTAALGKAGGATGTGVGAADIQSTVPPAAGAAGGSMASVPGAATSPGAGALNVAKDIGAANAVTAGAPATAAGPAVGGIAPAAEKLAAGGADGAAPGEAVAGIGRLGGSGDTAAGPAGAAKLELDLPAAAGAGSSLVSAPAPAPPAAGAAGAGANAAGVAVAPGGAAAPAAGVQVDVRVTGARVAAADASPTAGLPDALGPATRPSSSGDAVAKGAGPTGDVAPGPAPAAAVGVSSLLSGPTTRPFDGSAIAGAAVINPAADITTTAAADAGGRPAVTGPRIDIGQVAAGPTTAPAGTEVAVAAPKAAAPAPGAGAGAAPAVGTAASIPAASAGAGQSLVAAGPASLRNGNVIQPVGIPASGASAAPPVPGPQVGPVQIAIAPKLGGGAGNPAGAGETAGGGHDGAALAGTGKADVPGDGGKGDRPILASMNIPAVGTVPGTGRGGSGGTAVDAPPGPRPLAGPLATVTPELSVSVPKLAATEPLVQRSADKRRPLVEERGGTKESENAVHRGLGYLARQQEPDGRWTVITDDRSRPGRRPKTTHDMACTGLAVLCFLASDHTPDKEGEYRETVARGLEYLLAQQDEDGDLRGPKELRGGGSDRGNMYDHGIATMAVAEAALMTGDERYADAATKAADFIIASQDRRGGGWRYLPGEAGDTSVFGWQILALHNCEALGYEVPESSKALSRRFLRTVSEGRHKTLARYLPGGRGPDAVMTAEALFCRILLDEPLTDEGAREASEAITSNLKGSGDANLYFWYYASLSLNQLQNDAWKKWNVKTRDRLIAMQKRGGTTDGAWPGTNHYDARAGRVYTTALATLTLEVYYRYLPINPDNTGKGSGAARPEPEERPRRRQPPAGIPRRVLEPS